MTDILADNNARAPAFGLNSPLSVPFPLAAKTGTSKDYKDNFTLAYTPRWTIGVWVGNFDATPMQQISGVTGAGPIMHDLAVYLQRKYPSPPFETKALRARWSARRAACWPGPPASIRKKKSLIPPICPPCAMESTPPPRLLWPLRPLPREMYLSWILPSRFRPSPLSLRPPAASPAVRGPWTETLCPAFPAKPGGP